MSSKEKKTIKRLGRIYWKMFRVTDNGKLTILQEINVQKQY